MSDRIPNDALMCLAKKEEPRFLSLLLKNKDCLMETIAYGVKKGTDGHFWTPKNRMLFDLISEHYEKFQAILTRGAIDSVMESMETMGNRKISDDDRASMKMYWDQVYTMDVDIEDFKMLLSNINNRYIQWCAYKIMEEKMRIIVQSTSNQEEIVKEIREDFISIDCVDTDPYCCTMDLEEGMNKALEYITDRRENPDKMSGIPSYIKAIDDNYVFFEYGSYTIITGMVNGGKTTFMFNIAFNMARHGHNIVFVSLEKPAVSFFVRLICLHALVDYNRVRRGGVDERGLDDYHFNKICDAIKELKDKIKPYFTIVQLPQGTKVSKIIAEVDKIKTTMKSNGKNIDSLFVDYLGVIGNETHHPGRPDLDDAISSSRLQTYGRVNGYVTFVASQMKSPSSKEIRNKAKKATENDTVDVEVNTEDLAGSKKIIADADNALGCVLNGDSPPTKMFVHNTKARDSESRSTVVLDFDGKTGRVSDPVFENGQIQEVDDILYNTNFKIEDLESDDCLFSSNMDALVDQSNQVNSVEEKQIDENVEEIVTEELIKSEDEDWFKEQFNL